jgi:DNA-binding NarL/FixJ family response regulator
MTHTIMCIDDEQMVLDSIKCSIKNEPYQILTSTNGEDALSKLEQNHISVIITDMCMPKMDGFEFLTRAQKVCPDAVYMVLSAHSDIDKIMKAVNENHVWRYITKPWHKEELVLAIKNAVEIYEHRKERKEFISQLEEKNLQLSRMNNKLEDCVRERTKQLQQKNRILQMLIEDADITEILKVVCTAISEQFSLSPVFIHVPFLNRMISDKSVEPSEKLLPFLKEYEGQKTEIVNNSGICIPLVKNNLVLGTILIENGRKIKELKLPDEQRGFISVATLCLMQAWNLLKVEEMMNELNNDMKM